MGIYWEVWRRFNILCLGCWGWKSLLFSKRVIVTCQCSSKGLALLNGFTKGNHPGGGCFNRGVNKGDLMRIISDKLAGGN